MSANLYNVHFTRHNAVHLKWRHFWGRWRVSPAKILGRIKKMNTAIRWFDNLAMWARIAFTLLFVSLLFWLSHLPPKSCCQSVQIPSSYSKDSDKSQHPVISCSTDFVSSPFSTCLCWFKIMLQISRSYRVAHVVAQQRAAWSWRMLLFLHMLDW